VVVSDLVAFEDGSSVFAGGYDGSAVFGEGEANETILEPTLGEDVSDSFLARLGADGELVWAEKLGVLSDGGPPIVALDRFSDGDVVVLGFFSGTVVLGEGQPNETTLVSEGMADTFLARYDPDGQLVWARSDGGETSVIPHGMKVLSNDSIVTTGYYFGEVIFGEGEAHETVLESEESLYLARYYQTGELAWVQSEGGFYAGQTLAASPDGSFAFTGFAFGTEASFGLGQEGETTISWGGPVGDSLEPEPTMIFLASFEQEGTLRWVASADSDNGSQVAFPETNAAGFGDGFSAVTGSFYGNLAFGLGEPDEIVLENWSNGRTMFLARIDGEGTPQWAVGSQCGAASQAAGRWVSVTGEDNLLVSGSVSGAVTFGDPDDASSWLVSSGDHEPFAAIYDQEGELTWVARLGESWTPSGGAEAVAGLPDGTFLVAGLFEGTGTFVTGSDEEPIAIEANGMVDSFVLHVCP
jgi:hypothetical protein